MTKVNPYRVFGPTVPVMLGRAALMNEIAGRILKDTPDHVSIVGPAHYGKSVILSHLAEVHRTGSSHYLTTVYIDFRYSPPASDATFKQRLASELKAALLRVGSELSGYIDTEYERIHELLDDVFSDLAAGGVAGARGARRIRSCTRRYGTDTESVGSASRVGAKAQPPAGHRQPAAIARAVPDQGGPEFQLLGNLSRSTQSGRRPGRFRLGIIVASATGGRLYA